MTEAANGGSDTLQTPFVDIDLNDPFLINFEHVTLTASWRSTLPATMPTS
jgi:hypothetical protein